MGVVSYRTEKFDYANVYNNIVNGIKNYFEKNNIKVAVLGISGGIDSTVTAALVKASGVKLIGVSMPCSTNKDDEKNAASLVGEEFCNEFKEVNLQSTFETVEAFCTNASGTASTPISQGNIKARLRMITLYDIASKEGGIVIDTDNLTEHFLGFWTLHGDESDFNPIGGLWKHEVYGLAKWMKENIYNESKALDASIALMPTDGNGVKDGGDLAQIAEGKTYDDVDEILHAWVGLHSSIKASVIEDDFSTNIFKKLCEKHGKDVVKGVIMRSIRSEFKRRQRPFIIDIFNGNICEKNGLLIP
jgi:nicotinamide-nucleotide amidase